MRRMNARSPNIAIIGLLFVIILLAFKCWTLSSLNDDLGKEMEKLQAELKISGIRQEQFEKKNQILQSTIHEIDENYKSLKLQLDERESKLQDTQRTIKNKDQEILNLKNNFLTKDEERKDLLHQIEDKDNKIEELTSDSQHILSLKNEAEDALSEKDIKINSLMIELEQIRKEISQREHEKLIILPSVQAVKSSSNKKEVPLSPGSLLHVPTYAVHTQSVGVQGLKFHPGSDILPRQQSNVIRSKPRFSVADIARENIHDQRNEPKKVDAKPSNLYDHSKNNNVHDISKDIISKGVIEKPNFNAPDPSKNAHHETQLEENNRHVAPEAFNLKENMVLAPPGNHDNNLDAAIDEERKAVEDPADDQDEEGKELKQPGNIAGDNYENYEEEKAENPFAREENNAGEPRGIGAIEVPRQEKRPSLKEIPDEVNLVDEADPRANEKLYEANFDNKIRNLGRL